jgi:hypothetical protein
MKIAIKVIALVVLISVAGALGFYLGVRSGAGTMATLAAQNVVSNALSSINSSVMALEKNDLSYSLMQHQRDLNSALVDLGSYASSVPYWTCKERDKGIIRDAKAYLDTHPNTGHPPPQELLSRALKFCQ